MDKTNRRMDGKGGFFARFPNKLASHKALRNAERFRARGRTFWWSAHRYAWADARPHRRHFNSGMLYLEQPGGSLVVWKYVAGDRRPIQRIIEEALAAPSKTKGVLP